MNNETLKLITGVVRQDRPGSNAVIVRFASTKHADRFLIEFGGEVLSARDGAAPTASDAGTITVWSLSPELGVMVNDSPRQEHRKRFVAYDDHLQHVAAAVEQAGWKAEIAAEDRITNLIASLQDAEAELAKLRSTAGVGEVKSNCPDCGEVVKETDMRSHLLNIHGWLEAATAPVSAAPTAVDVLDECSIEEVAAFEEWAAGQKYDMTTHPLHWLFLNERTYAARQGWKAALSFARATLPPSAGAPVSREDEDPNWMGKIPHAFSAGAPVSGAGQPQGDDKADAERWRFFDQHAQSVISGRRVAEWIAFDGAMEHGSRNAAIDAVRAALAAKQAGKEPS